MPATGVVSPAAWKLFHFSGTAGVMPAVAKRPCRAASTFKSPDILLWQSRHVDWPAKCMPYSLTSVADARAGSRSMPIKATTSRAKIFFPMAPLYW